MKYLVLILILVLMPFLPMILNKLFGVHKKPKAHHVTEVGEARKILELGAGASEEDIKAAHKRLIQKNHPDAGGSKYLASKINEARDILIKNLKEKS